MPNNAARFFARTFGAVIGRALLSVAGFFLVFNVFFIALNKQLPNFQHFWKGPWFLLQLPFSSCAAFFHIFFTALSIPSAYFHAHVRELAVIISPFWYPCLQGLILFGVVALAIAIFERRLKTKKISEVVTFYLLIPPMFWLLVPFIERLI